MNSFQCVNSYIFIDCVLWKGAQEEPIKEIAISFQITSHHRKYICFFLMQSYTTSNGLLDAKVILIQAMPCFNTTWKSKGSLLTMCKILNLSLHFIATDVSKLILFPFKVMLTSLQSNSIMSQRIFLFNFTFSGVDVSVILNKCMLPFVLHNFMST